MSANSNRMIFMDQAGVLQIADGGVDIVEVDGGWDIIEIGGQGVAGIGKRYEAVLGDGINTEFVVNHNLHNVNVVAQVVKNASPWQRVEVDIEADDIDNLRVKFSLPPDVDSYKIIVMY